MSTSICSRRLLRQERNRRGQSLILVFFALIVLIGIMALTLDFGFVLLARRQMQTGVSAAALEGLRFRKQHPPLETLVALLDNPGACPDLTNVNVVLDCLQAESGCDPSNVQCLKDYIRKKAGRHSLRLSFDDDFDLGYNETTIGAGIASNLTQGDGFRTKTLGDGTLGTSGILANHSSFIYRPDSFELNKNDEVHGDMVVGQFVDYHGARPIDGEPHEELSDYRRTDFRTSGEPDYNSAIGDDAFLVRMRRTHNPNNLDNVSGVSSSGGGLPLLVGNLAWFGSTNPTGRYSIRRDGVTVRATAIAQEKVAVHVWETSDPRFYQPLPLAVSVDDLTAFIEGNLTVVLPTLTTLTSVGEEVPVGTVVPQLRPGYIAVFTKIGTLDRVVGFYLHDSMNSGLQPNASPRLHDAWQSLGRLSPVYRDEIRRKQVDTARRLPLATAPCLVRSVR